MANDDLPNLTPGRLDEALNALEEQLGSGGSSFDLTVIGGSALLALGLIDRATRDVDIVALGHTEGLSSADPLPEALARAAARVARDFGLPAGWLNSGPADLLRLGLPVGFDRRRVTRVIGPSLTIQFASRYDQIHFKLFAMVDQGSGKHEVDLRALDPSEDELMHAARWTMTHDPSPAFRDELLAVLRYLGVTDADLGS
jgi:hypothetical protein